MEGAWSNRSRPSAATEPGPFQIFAVAVRWRCGGRRAHEYRGSDVPNSPPCTRIWKTRQSELRKRQSICKRGNRYAKKVCVAVIDDVDFNVSVWTHRVDLVPRDVAACRWLGGCMLADICLRRFLRLLLQTSVIGGLMMVFAPSLVSAQQPPWEGCRPVSKIEYNAAKAEYLLTSRSHVYIRTGHFWRRYYWHCPV